ncbi:putative lipoprotein [Ahrensia sp. R2A130]|nr:putative lipoprotein [Ahrensia sp. R2A130]
MQKITKAGVLINAGFLLSAVLCACDLQNSVCRIALAFSNRL